MKSIYKITVNNWEKYNSKSKPGHPSVFISKKFFDDAKIQSLSAGGKLLYLGLILARGEVRESSYTASTELLVRWAGGSGQHVDRLMFQLQSLQLVTYEKTTLIEVNRIEKKRKEKNQTSNESIAAPAEASAECVFKFDFESLYQNYPKKEGKSRGFAVIKRQVKTSDDYDNLGIAISNYRKRCEEKGTEPRYIKQFSTFANEWRDWVDPNHGQTDIFTKPQEIGRRFYD